MKVTLTDTEARIASITTDFDLNKLGMVVSHGGDLRHGWVVLEGDCLLNEGDTIPLISDKIRHLAEKHDATVCIDRDGDVALLGRIYDEEGIQQVRHNPDPCDFRPASWWESATPDQVERAVC